jgi:acetyl-CoA carboxylase biotin carboxyl carrier protein
MANSAKNGPKAAKSSGAVDLHEVERLLAFMEEHKLEEFEYERDGVRIRLKKPSTAFWTGYPPDSAIHSEEGSLAHGAHPTAVAHTASHAPAAPSHGAPAEKAAGEDLHMIKSPIVGTYYSSPSPEADPYVAIGSHVESGQVLCIIEAMKLMNEIESDMAGEVVRIFAENGQPVEYGQPLFGIRPQRKK